MVIENLLGGLYITLFNTNAYEVDTIVAISQMRQQKHTEVMYLRSIMWLISNRAMIYPQSTPRTSLLSPPMYVISYITALLSLIYTKGASLGEMK